MVPEKDFSIPLYEPFGCTFERSTRTLERELVGAHHCVQLDEAWSGVEQSNWIEVRTFYVFGIYFAYVYIVSQHTFVIFCQKNWSEYLTLFQKRVSFHLIFLLFSGNESIFFHLYPSNLLFSRKEEVLGAAVKNFLILEKSKFHWDKPKNMASFQKRGSFRSSCQKLPHSRKE